PRRGFVCATFAASSHTWLTRRRFGSPDSEVRVGNRPTPTAIRKLSGLHMERVNEKEPAFNKTPAVRPRGMGRIANEEWDRLYPELTQLGLLHSANAQCFAAYCRAYAAWETAQKLVDERGTMLEEPVMNRLGEQVGTKQVANPMLMEVDRADKRMRAWA